MKYQDVYEIVNDAVKNGKGYKFVATLNDGKTCMKRLFISTSGNLCEFARKSRSKGYLLATNEYKSWTEVKPFTRSQDNSYARFNKRIVKVYSLLDKSGLWQHIKELLFHILQMDENTKKDFFQDLTNMSPYSQEFSDKYQWANDATLLDALCSDKCWKSIDYDKYDRDYYNELVEKSIRDKKSYHHFWRKNYDNRLSIEIKDNETLGFYSEEYKDCANGHYYLLLDATHAIHYEDDWKKGT